MTKGAGAEAALLVVGHGSRSEAGVRQCMELAEVVRAGRPGARTGLGFIEWALPSLHDAIDELVSEGVGRLVAVPLVLLGAGHLKNDGPDALAAARRRHRDVRFDYGRDLGVHPTVLAVAEDRVTEALAAAGGPGEDCAVVLVGRGSTDPDANADLYKVARLLADSRGLGAIEPAFVSLARPGVLEAMERARLLGARRLAVVPYFLFTGRLVERIADQASSWAAQHPGFLVVHGSEMGPDPRLAGLVAERFHEATSGSASMNCDLCLYRVALPGYEARAQGWGGRPGAAPGTRPREVTGWMT